MNSEFLKHLQSITPQGMAAEKRLFIPADVIKKEVEDADELRRLDSIDELSEGLMRKKRLHRARTSGKPRTPKQRKALDTAYDSELGRRVARKLRKGGARKATVRGFFKDKPITDAAEKAFEKFNADEYKKHKELQAKGVNPKRLGFAEGISESSLGMRKGIRLGVAVDEKGHTHLGHRNDAALLRAYSKIRKDAGLDPRITVIPPKYKPSDEEYAVMQDHARKRREGINKKYGIDESAKKTYKRVKKTAKRLLKKIGRSLMQPSDAADIMFTGRNF